MTERPGSNDKAHRISNPDCLGRSRRKGSGSEKGNSTATGGEVVRTQRQR